MIEDIKARIESGAPVTLSVPEAKAMLVMIDELHREIWKLHDKISLHESLHEQKSAKKIKVSK